MNSNQFQPDVIPANAGIQQASLVKRWGVQIEPVGEPIASFSRCDIVLISTSTVSKSKGGES
jgi:hypothetical protein